jgi:hypothetical protein
LASVFSSDAVSKPSISESQSTAGPNPIFLKELPKLNEGERRAVRQALLDLANQNEDIALANQSALEGALLLDRMEEKDAKDQSR